MTSEMEERQERGSRQGRVSTKAGRREERSTEDVCEELPGEEAMEKGEEEEGREDEEVGNLADALAGMRARCQNCVIVI
jgi:hypothetical protein